jgi:hypothetical protein
MFQDHVHIDGVSAGLGKSLDLHKDRAKPDEQVQLVVSNQLGERQSLVVLWGDLNGAIAAMGHDPAQG